MILYFIQNKINNKLYIGKTIQPIKKRFRRHLYHYHNNTNRRLYDAMRCHSIDNFSYGILLESNCISNEQLNLLEVICIYMFDAYYENKKGYNMTHGGDGGPMSPESVEKTRKKKKGKKKGKKKSKKKGKKSASKKS